PTAETPTTRRVDSCPETDVNGVRRGYHDLTFPVRPDRRFHVPSASTALPSGLTTAGDRESPLSPSRAPNLGTTDRVESVDRVRPRARRRRSWRCAGISVRAGDDECT